MLVTSSRSIPADAQRRASSAARISESCSQPLTVTNPSRASTATTRAAAPKRSTAVVRNVVVERGRADEHARRAGRQRRVDQLEAAVAASHLHGDAHGRNALQEPQIRLAREGAVEIDEVEPGRALGDEALGGCDRVAALDRHLLAPALGEADDASRKHVESRVDGEVLAL